MPDGWAAYPIWRGMQGYVPRMTIASGYEVLDRCLPGGGWPVGALIEVISERSGIGELSLFMPAMRRISDIRQGLIAWIAPRFIPYAPALRLRELNLNRLLVVQTRDGNESLWAAEQALRCAGCAGLLAWPETVSRKSSRRLQLAAEAQRCLAILFRSHGGPSDASTATLKLQLRRSVEQGVAHLQILKCRGAHPMSIDLRLSSFHEPALAGGAT